MDFNKTLSTLTMAGLVGLVVLNWDNANAIFQALSNAANSHVYTVQGRG